MANITAVTFLAGLMMILAASGSGEQCPRYSPEDIWYSDMAPLLNETHLEELRVFTRIVFNRLGDGQLFTFMPHIKGDPEKVGNLTEKMEMVKEKVSALVEWSYTVVERAWLDLGEASRQFIAGNKTAKQVKLKMKELEKAHHRINKIVLRAAIKDLAKFFRHVIPIVIEGVTQILESELDEAPPEAADIVKMIQDKIIKISPGDYLGMIVRRFIGRSLGTIYSRAPKEEGDMLFNVMPRIDKLMTEFKEVNPLTVDSWMGFLEKAMEHSVAETKRRAETGKDDLDLVYKNEVYLCEVMMNIITLHGEEPLDPATAE